MDFDKANFTAREKDILLAAFLSHKDAFNLDWNALAVNAGFKNAASARACFAPIKTKIKALTDGGEQAASPKKAKGNSKTKLKTEEGSSITETKGGATKAADANKKRKLDHKDDGAQMDASANDTDSWVPINHSG